ncbi:helix-turn-helix domain-containing protein [Streptomyces sp. So13.3]|uniref:GlxA family transcriptional regulator n=1 Tax=Streptomyces TaxID=1883 RepID=UPI001106722E|nr:MULTISPECIES: helix-turn-helix domain-containing protein [Streptomyces]MCZ4096987.1 helix-turn-helix domain-containing protein [Streptomyces sp. H39-C1]QNA70817.1 helix-turn-helix domain-containing protein [Streptomyces sp. So13.3]
MSPLRVGVLAYPGCFASEVFGVPDLLTMATHVAAAQGSLEPAYETSVVSPRRRVIASGGSAIDVSAVRPVDVLIVPGFELSPTLDLDATLAGLGPEVAAIRSQAASGTAVVSICVGAFLVAEAGLLGGREATTSWLFADRFARRYADVRLRPERLVVTDRGVTTTAAFSAMYDFALHFIREHDGPRIARSTARIALVDDARSTQAPYVDPGLIPTVGREFSLSVKRWLDQNLSTRYDLPVLAREFHVSTRTMLRRFGDETGQTPLAYLHTVRVRRARQLLETTDRAVASIAADVGYRDPGAFGDIFARHTGRRPREYRVMFHRRGDQHEPTPTN